VITTLETVPEVGSIPQPGIYQNIPFDVYLSWPVLSNSRLHAATRSLLHFHEQEPIEETDAMRFGTLCHAGRLEPSAIYRRYVVMPDLTAGITLADGSPATNPRATKQYKQRVEAWLSQQGDKQVVGHEDFDAMVGVVASLDRDQQAREWFASEGPTELSIVWDDPETGLRLKSRIDKLATRLQIMADLKTCRDCKRFQGAIAERGYHRQGGMYLDGWEVLTGEVYRFGIAAVENLKPFGVMCAPLHDDAVACGREEFHRTLRQIADAKRTNSWPGYESPAAWTLPAWYAGGDSEQLTLTIGGKQVAV
jgi:hypothetical protein